MRLRLLFVPLICLGLAAPLGGCDAFRNLQPLVGAVTEERKNPITETELLAIESTVLAARSAAFQVLTTRQCRRTESPSLSNICVRHSVQVLIKDANEKLTVALPRLRRFVAENQTINGIKAYNEIKALISEINALKGA